MRTPFRPSVTALEARLALSSHAHAVAGPVDPTYAASGAYGDSARQGVAAFYATEAARDKAPVVFLGDSTSLLWGSNYPAAGTAAWEAHFSPLGAEDFGVLGDETQNVLYRVEQGDLAGQPKVVVLQVGLNDLLLANRTPAATAAGITDVVQAIRQESPTTKVILVGILPTAYPGLNASIARTNALIAPLGRQKNVQYVNPGRQFFEPDGTVIPGLLLDVYHPGSLGFQILAGQLVGPVTADLRS